MHLVDKCIAYTRHYLIMCTNHIFHSDIREGTNCAVPVLVQSLSQIKTLSVQTQTMCLSAGYFREIYPGLARLVLSLAGYLVNQVVCNNYYTNYKLEMAKLIFRVVLLYSIQNHIMTEWYKYMIIIVTFWSSSWLYGITCIENLIFRWWYIAVSMLGNQIINFF